MLFFFVFEKRKIPHDQLRATKENEKRKHSCRFPDIGDDAQFGPFQAGRIYDQDVDNTQHHAKVGDDALFDALPFDYAHYNNIIFLKPEQRFEFQGEKRVFLLFFGP